MNFPGQDKEELLELKQLLKEYRVLRTEQLYRWFSDKDRRVAGALFSQREQNGTHILVIVETPEQIETLEIPGADWFCTVAADGTIQRYLQEESE